MTEDITKKLKDFVSYLDSRIEQEEHALSLMGEPDYEFNDLIGSVREPVFRTILAYKNAKEELYRLLPELRELKRRVNS